MMKALVIRNIYAFDILNESGAVGSTQRRTDDSAKLVGLIGRIVKTIYPVQTKSCNDCLIDILKVDKRCEHCGALQRVFQG